MTRRDALFDLGKSYAFSTLLNATIQFLCNHFVRYNGQVGGHFRLIDEDYGNVLYVPKKFEKFHIPNKVCSFSKTNSETKKKTRLFL